MTSQIWKVVVKDRDKQWEILKVSRTATSMILTKRVINTIDTHVTRHEAIVDHHAQIVFDDENGETWISEEQQVFIPTNYLSSVTFELYHAMTIKYDRLDKRFLPFKNVRKEYPVIVDVKDYWNPQKVIECGVFLVAPDHYGKFYELLKDFQNVKLVPIKEFSPHVVFGFWQTKPSTQC